MKVRNGFVSNSSSSSFVVSLDEITAKQLSQIQNHIAVAATPSFLKKLKASGQDMDYWFASEGDAWDIEVTDNEVRGHTIMDNFSMHTFFDIIGVDAAKVEWDDSY